MNEVCHSDEEQTGNGPGQRPAQGSKSQSILNIQGDTIVKNLNCRKKPEWVPVSQCQKTQKETLQVRETLFFQAENISKVNGVHFEKVAMPKKFQRETLWFLYFCKHK